jgi:Zn-dependent peptidase ImmA (M78 family)/DNA-binding XRE family transcriptional regulator
MSSILSDFAPPEVGKRLRSAREAAGITQAAAASAINVARTTVVAIEKGERRPQLREIQALCKFYGLSINALCREEAPQLDFEVQFRRTLDCPPGPMEDAAKLLGDLARAEIELESLLGIRRQYPDAQALRHWLGLGFSPIQDVFSLLEFSLGARVYVRKLHSNISAVFAFTPSSGPCFLINANHRRSRRVQSAIHELGHYISNRSAPKILTDSSSLATREERYAVAFGPAFLTPARHVIQKFQEITAGSSKLTRRHVIFLAHYFGVSREAIVRRLEELKLVKRGTWDWFEANGGITDEQAIQLLGERFLDGRLNKQPTESSELRLHQLAAQVYHKNLMSEGQLARLLRVDRTDLRVVLDNLPLDEEGVDCGILS